MDRRWVNYNKAQIGGLYGMLNESGLMTLTLADINELLTLLPKLRVEMLEKLAEHVQEQQSVLEREANKVNGKTS